MPELSRINPNPVMADAAMGLTPTFPVMWAAPVAVVAVFDKVAKDAAAPKSTGAGLAKARAVCPVPNVSAMANVAMTNRRSVLPSG